MVERGDVGAALDLSDPARPRRVLCHGSRGAGKSWWLASAARQAEHHGFTVAKAAGRASDRDLPLGGLASLLQPFGEDLDRLGPDGDVLRRAFAFITDGTDAVAVKVATLKALAAIADRVPLCLVIDDVDMVDTSSREVLDAALARTTADPILVLATAAASSAFAADAVVRLGPLPLGEITTMLVERGVNAGAAERCAVAAAGNPGVAVAMADGLSDAQRAGTAPVPDLPRLGGELAEELQSRMRALGESSCRALVVAAAADGGDLGAIGAALGLLGEPGLEVLEAVEEAGVVEIVGTRLAFPDPWMRHAAYHLLAPASRRAAHRALAAGFTEAHQAASRVWHLVGAASGPSDSLAEALALVAADAARRGAAATAAQTYERAVEFAASLPVRDSLLSTALRSTIDGGELAHAVRLAEMVGGPTAGTMPGLPVELQCALADVGELATGRPVVVPETPGASASPKNDRATGGPNARRLASRRQAWAAAVAGDHRRAVAAVGDPPAAPLDLVVWAVASRHAGRTREAREALARADAAAGVPWLHLGQWFTVVQADLDVLAGRPADASVLALPAGAAPVLRAQAAAILARARLMADPSLEPAAEPTAWADEGEGALAEIRGLVRAGVAMADADLLEQAIALADKARLPIEAGEARLWWATIQSKRGSEVTDAVRLSHATLQRCGVRGWDARCAALLTPAPSAPRVVDPAITGLSQSELRVAEAVAEGLTNREAAAKLFLSVKTVDFHLQQIYRKLAVRSRTELAVRMTLGTPTVGNR